MANPHDNFFNYNLHLSSTEITYRYGVLYSSTWTQDQEINVVRSTGGLLDETISAYLNIRTCNNEEIVEKNGDELEEPDICTICQDDLYQRNGVIATLECRHEYHETCIREWLHRKNVCPLCNGTALPVEDEGEEEFSYEVIEINMESETDDEEDDEETLEEYYSDDE